MSFRTSYHLLFLATACAVVGLFTPLLPNAQAAPGGSGGGDNCEKRFKAVAQDIAKWIQGGGPKALSFELSADKKMTVSEYSTRMLGQVGAKVKCVGPGETDFPVFVNGTPKECRSFVGANGTKQVICDRSKFYAGLANPDNNPAQYPIVHHEFATLAGLEAPNGDDSQYALSNQIAAFLEVQSEIKLAVKPLPNMCNLLVETGDLTGQSGEDYYIAGLLGTSASMLQALGYRIVPSGPRMRLEKTPNFWSYPSGYKTILDSVWQNGVERVATAEDVALIINVDLSHRDQRTCLTEVGFSKMNGEIGTQRSHTDCRTTDPNLELARLVAQLPTCDQFKKLRSN